LTVDYFKRAADENNSGAQSNDEIAFAQDSGVPQKLHATAHSLKLAGDSGPAQVQWTCVNALLSGQEIWHDYRIAAEFGNGRGSKWSSGSIE
jgi:hypothetical protein